MRRRVLSVAVVLFYGAMLMAQSAPAVDKDAAAATAAAATPKGSVTGHVYLGDTGGPARFALVMLKLVPNAESVAAAEKSRDEMMKSMVAAMGGSDNKKFDKAVADNINHPDPDQKAAMAQAANAMSVIGDLTHSATTGVDGAYVVKGVKPGTYYVYVVLNGYVDPIKAIPAEQLNNPDTTVQEHVSEQLTTLTIDGDEAAHLDLRVERGAAIGGRVTYDDGSPAMGWDVKVIKVKKATDGATIGDTSSRAEVLSAIAHESHVTDDHGHYRIAGLEGGDYIVVASLSAGSPNSGGMFGGQVRLKVMSGNVTNQQSAKLVSVVLGEEKGDVDLVMPLSSLHSITGKITAKTDGHGINSATSISLVDNSSSGPATLGTTPMAQVQDDGSFRFDYVTDGSYTIRIHNAEIVQRTGKTTKVFGIDMPDDKTLRSFENGEQKVMVSGADVSGVAISLTEKPKSKDDDDDK